MRWTIAAPGTAKLYGNSWIATQPTTLGSTVQSLTRPGAIALSTTGPPSSAAARPAAAAVFTTRDGTSGMP